MLTEHESGSKCCGRKKTALEDLPTGCHVTVTEILSRVAFDLVTINCSLRVQNYILGHRCWRHIARVLGIEI